MLELHQAHLEELIPAEALWSQVFGDDAAFQRDFYTLTDLSGPLVLTEDGQVQAMLALPEATLTFPDGWNVTTRRSVIVTVSPVFRLRPGRATLSRTEKLPRPGIFTVSPFSRCSATSSKKVSTISLA